MSTPGRRFVDAIVARDEDALRGVLTSDVDFKGLTPGRLWEASEPNGVRDAVLGAWFEEQDRVVGVREVTEGVVADTAHISYRFDLELPDGPYVVEQQAYYRAGPEGISYLRMLCSGFRRRESMTVLGVDGCSVGWVGALVTGAEVELFTAPTIEELVAAARERAEPEVVAIDIPIGLPDHGSRHADKAARASLPPGRKSSVFPTPIREAVLSGSHPEAQEASRKVTGKGISVQAFGICRKIAEVDAWVHAGPGVPVIEVHPEVSFAEMGADTVPSKRTPAGVASRTAALAGQGMVLPAVLRGHGFGVDDALDACAVAWSAGRYARGESRSLPDPPEVFSDGLEAAIHV